MMLSNVFSTSYNTEYAVSLPLVTPPIFASGRPSGILYRCQTSHILERCPQFRSAHADNAYLTRGIWANACITQSGIIEERSNVQLTLCGRAQIPFAFATGTSHELGIKRNSSHCLYNFRKYFKLVKITYTHEYEIKK